MKKATTKKVDEKKMTQAKETVDKLLEGISIKKSEVDKVASRVEILQSSGESEWLEGQIQAQAEKIEELENIVIEHKANYEKLYDKYTQLKESGVGEVPKDVKDIMEGVKRIFKDLDDNYQGRNQAKTRYEQANVRPLLEKFLLAFPFLRKKVKK